MSAIFRRIRSPREVRDREAQEHQQPNRSLSSGNLPRVGHRRHRSDEAQIAIQPNSYPHSEANHLSQGIEENPPALPPRNRPASIGHTHLLRRESSDDDPYYVTPADTIRRQPGNLVQGLNEKGPIPTRSEMKQMEMHERTLSQKQVLGHRRTGSFGHVIDNSDYSTPWNLIQEQEKQKERVKERDKENTVAARMLPPPKPQRSIDRQKKTVRQSVPGDSSDDIIHVSPPPGQSQDRSQSSSPSSPPFSGGHTVSDDYDEPWDKKFKEWRKAAHLPLRHSGEPGGHHSHHDHHHHHHHHYPPPPPSHPPPPPNHPPPPSHLPPPSVDRSSPQPEIRPRVNSRGLDRVSPPLIEIRPHTSSSRSASEKTRRLSPQPEVRARLGTRGSSERNISREHLGERSSSPLPPEREAWVGSRGVHHSNFPPEVLPSSSSPEGAPPRSYSVSIPINQRKLPSPPLLESDRQTERRWTGSPTNLFHIDVSIPLDDQPWYHGSITRAEAESILAEQENFSFLVRNSESCKTDFSLSIRDLSCGFIHLRIVYERGGYVLGQFSSHFQNVPQCIAFYTRQRLNIRGAEHKKLQYPVPR